MKMVVWRSGKDRRGERVLPFRAPRGGRYGNEGVTITAMTHLEPILAPVIEKAGFQLVRLRLMGGAGRTLQVMAERADGSMDVEGCTALTHALLDFIEQDDPIDGDYEIEVSSPGIDRPLTRLTDFARWSGHEARIELHAPIPTPAGARKRLRVRLAGIDGQDVCAQALDGAGGDLRFPFPAVANAKLVLTDRLISAALKTRAAKGVDAPAISPISAPAMTGGGPNSQQGED